LLPPEFAPHGASANGAVDRRRFYVSGQAVELWENAELPFGWTRDDMESYAADGEWELLFNALILNSALEVGSSPVD
jgi:hypothetical protein